MRLRMRRSRPSTRSCTTQFSQVRAQEAYLRGWQFLKLIPGFLLYAFAVVAFAVFMIYKIAPVYGRRNALIYLSICSTVGSISVMSVKAFGIALKLTFAGHNQFSHPSTYVFMILTAVCIVTQMNYFNKALASFPTNM